MLKAVEIRKLSLEDLKNKVSSHSEEIFRLRMQISTGSVKDKHAIVKKRRELAKIKTILNEKQKLGDAKK
jgi:large subunit ribosomal protein L29